MRGTRKDKLWTMNDTTIRSLNATIGSLTIAERIKFYHASLFSPTLATLAKAIDAGYLTTFPAFTSKQVNKYPPLLAATHKGHLKAQRQGLRSTSKHTVNNLKQLHTISPPLPTIIEEDIPSPSLVPRSASATTTMQLAPMPYDAITHLIPPNTISPLLPQIPTPPATINAPPLSGRYSDAARALTSLEPKKLPRSKYVYPACIPITRQIHTDQTGAFTVPSSNGNKYLFVLYEYDSNYIYAAPIPS